MGGYLFLLVTTIATITATIAVSAEVKNIPNLNSIFIDSYVTISKHPLSLKGVPTAYPLYATVVLSLA
jgi:hypothetical protein